MLQPKFELGQKVYAVNSRIKQKKVHVLCDVCDSTGLVKLNDNRKYFCPACCGKMETINYGHEYYIAYPKAEIGRVETIEFLPEYGYKSEINYMLKPTGVGSGRTWKENMLFETESEANTFCNMYMPSDNYYKTPILKPVDKDEYL